MRYKEEEPRRTFLHNCNYLESLLMGYFGFFLLVSCYDLATLENRIQMLSTISGSYFFEIDISKKNVT